MKTYKQDNALMDILEIKEISRVICDTNMGTLKLRIRKGEDSYQFVLDAVELSKEMNHEIMKLLFPPIEVSVSTESFKELPKVGTTILKKAPKKVVKKKK